MIKLSWMARADSEAELENQLKYARKIDLDVIDFHIGKFPRTTKFLRHIKKEALKAGLPIGYLGGPTLVGEADGRKKRMDQAKQDVDLTGFLGAQMLRMFARHKWPATVEEQEKYWKPMIEDFQELADYAAPKGVALGLQNHNHSSFCMNADQALRILKEVNRENFTYLMDSGQWQGSIGGSPRGFRDINVDIYKDYMERMAPHTTLVRAKIYKIDNGWEEWIDYPRVFKILAKAKFNGNVSIVFEGGEPPRNRFDDDQCVALAAKHLREVAALSNLYDV